MIGYIKGKVTFLYDDQCIVEANGVGYRILISAATREELMLHEEVRLFTYLQVREDLMMLYGFAVIDEYDLFMMLITVSGIGPKVALGILSSIRPEAFCLAVQQKNKPVLMNLPGIGKKSAERLLLELADKVGAGIVVDGYDVSEVEINTNDNFVTETIRALAGLGYTEGEVTPLAKRLALEHKDTAHLLRAILNELGKGRR